MKIGQFAFVIATALVANDFSTAINFENTATTTPNIRSVEPSRHVHPAASATNGEERNSLAAAWGSVPLDAPTHQASAPAVTNSQYYNKGLTQRAGEFIQDMVGKVRMFA